MPQNEKRNLSKVQWFFSLMNKRERYSFWLMTGINIFFLLVMSIFAHAGIIHCLAFGIFIEVAIIGYYIIVNKFERKTKTREWIDAIAFAVVAATLIRTFFIEAYTIPTGSMEKSLLVGDFLFVSKVNYGARAPMTPISFPFAHNTMPVTGSKSYLEWFSMPYFRLPGFQKIKNNDVVVFNYPYEGGRPVDKKDNYIKRCIAIPGDEIQLVRGEVFLNGKHIDFPKRGMFQYEVRTDGSEIPAKVLYGMGMRSRKIRTEEDIYRSLSEDDATRVNENTYYMHLTAENLQKIRAMSTVVEVDTLLQESAQVDHGGQRCFPNTSNVSWNREYFGPVYLPKAGDIMPLDSMKFWLYDQAIRVYENNPTFEMRNGRFFLEGKEITSYQFKQNYYFMMGDNRHNSLDSRFWGFVPEDHVVGKALFVWMSWDSSAPKFWQKIRWERLFRGIN